MKSVVLVVLFAFVVGCGSDHKVVSVTGKATRAGAPVPNLVVHFIPEDGRPSKGVTDEQGKFTLDYDRTKKGAEVGKHKVYVEYRAASPLEEGKGIAVKELTANQKAILMKYGSAKSPQIQVTIEKRDQEVEIKLD